MNNDYATPGPWHVETFDESSDEIPHAVVVATNKELPNLIAKLFAATNTNYIEDAVFIANARTTIDALLRERDEAQFNLEQTELSSLNKDEEINDLQRERDALREALSKVDRGGCDRREHDWSPNCGTCSQCIARAAQGERK
jgi:hypothetical protein